MGLSPNPADKPLRRRGTAHGAAAAMILATTAGAYWRCAAAGLPGFDSFPLILSSRIESWGDAAGIFREKLMDGWFPDADFYRPITSLSFAFDYAIWELNATGYQLTDAIIFAAAATALYFLSVRLLGKDAAPGPLLALTFFLLHRVHVECVPVPPRRAEYLCLFFAAMSLWSQLSPRYAGRRRPAWIPALWMLAAMASKDTALLFPAVSAAAIIAASAGAIRARLIAACLQFVPHMATLGLVLAARVAVLGGLGGYKVAAELNRIDSPWRGAIDYAAMLVFPQTPAPERWGVWLVGALAGSVAVLSTLRLSGNRAFPPAERDADDTELRVVRRSRGLWAFILSVTWSGVLLLSFVFSERLRPYYMAMPVGAASLAIGAAGESLAGAIRRGTTSARGVAMLIASLLLIWLGWHARYSIAIHAYDEYARGAAASERFLSRLEERIREAPNGTIIEAPPLPMWVPPAQSRPTVFGAALLMERSVRAWAELRFPGRRLRFNPSSADGPPIIAPDELAVILHRRHKDFVLERGAAE